MGVRLSCCEMRLNVCNALWARRRRGVGWFVNILLTCAYSRGVGCEPFLQSIDLACLKSSRGFYMAISNELSGEMLPHYDG